LFSFRFYAVHPKDVRDCQLRQLFEVPFNPDSVVREFTTGISIVRQEALAVKKGPPSWLYEKAKDEFLAHILAKKRADTHRDYTGKLRPPELDRFASLKTAGAADHYSGG
jgi:hypothetical protein